MRRSDYASGEMRELMRLSRDRMGESSPESVDRKAMVAQDDTGTIVAAAEFEVRGTQAVGVSILSMSPGAGRVLAKACMASAVEMGATWALAIVRADDARVVRWHLLLGYMPVGYSAVYYHDGGPALVMKIDLLEAVTA